MKVHIGPFRKNRKVKIVIDNFDTFSLFSTLAQIIHPALIKFKEERQKMPGVPFAFFDDDAPMKPDGNYTEEALNKADENYTTWLDEAIWAFGEIAAEYPGEEAFYKIKQEYAHLTDDERFNLNVRPAGKGMVASDWLETIEFDQEGKKKYHERIRAALETFGKEFEALWW